MSQNNEAARPGPFEARRLLDGPIIHPGMSKTIGTNINGPAPIRVPDWLPGALGRYYMYFAHHRGTFIRLAYADRIEGPWRIHEKGVLPLTRSGFAHHVASPEIHVDHTARKVWMLYHGGDEIKRQYTRLAVSDDGLNFTAYPENLMNCYARLFPYGDHLYALTMPGQFYRAPRIDGPWEKGPCLFTPDMRHAAVRVQGDQLQVIYSNRGDAPESLLQTTIDLVGDWKTWQEAPPSLLLAPERDFEGGRLVIEPSVIGPADNPVRQLRDPAIFEDEDCRLILFYGVAGEQGLAIAELTSRV